MDKITKKRRSENMRRIQSKGMKPEMIVRSAVHALGYRYRLHAKDLPGKPDLVFRSRKKVIFVHGCFWHQHTDPHCKISRMPKSRLDYWGPKLERNIARDLEVAVQYQDMGWERLVIWECETKDEDRLNQIIEEFLD